MNNSSASQMTSVDDSGLASFTFSSGGDRCRGRFKIVSKSAPVLLIATGGSKKGSLSESWTKLPKLLVRNEISVIIFDFSGQGHSGGDRRYLTLTKGVQNLVDVLATVTAWDWVDVSRLALMGSSFGGNVVLDYLSSDDHLPVRGATLKSPCIDLRESYLQELGPEGMREWERKGYSESAGLAWEVIEDAERSDLRRRLFKIREPLLITHGCSDESVPISQSREVRDGAGGIVDLLEMKGVNHHYSERDDWRRMAAVHIGWLKQLFVTKES